MRIPLHAAAALIVARRLRYELDALNRRCPRGHGGHAVDARFCRICGKPLERGEGER